MAIKYSLEMYQGMKESLIGSLVAFDDSTPLFGIKYRGLGIVIDTRRERGEIYLKIAWSRTPYFHHIEERKIGWHSYDLLFIVQNKYGVRSNDYQSKNS